MFVEITLNPLLGPRQMVLSNPDSVFVSIS